MSPVKFGPPTRTPETPLTGSLPSPDALMASTDWTVSPIGPPAGWPASLRNVVDVMFGMPSPAFIIWGSQHTLLYNEPFRAPAAAPACETFGKPLPVASRYVGDEFAPLVRGALAGQAVVRQQVHFGPRA